jgi:peptidoglycan/xylan/chitin deacetylase (PgdA/CDA1 family)
MHRFGAFLLLLLAFAVSPASAQKRIALTFDDVPRAAGAFLTPDERTRRLIAALRKARVGQVAFFVNPGALTDPVRGPGGERHIADYVRAGHVIANHGLTHLKLSATDAAVYIADIDRAEAWLRGRPGYRPWFRFPYLDEGGADKAKRDVVRSALATRGLSNGYVTAEASDWHLENLARLARQAGRPIDMEALRDLYVESHVAAADTYDALAVKSTGRSPIHVMLLHETDLAAFWIGDLVRALRKDGWEIVSADRAYADPIAAEAARVDVPSAQGTLTEALAWAAKVPPPRWYERNDTRIYDQLFAERVLHEKVIP